jgi:hypothetical protein
VSDFAAEIEALDPTISLVVEHHSQPGDFPARLMIVLWDGRLVDEVGEATSLASYAAYAAIASVLETALIAPIAGVDPYVAHLVRPSGEVSRVTLDAARLDDLGEVSVAPDSPMVPVPELSFLPRPNVLIP